MTAFEVVMQVVLYHLNDRTISLLLSELEDKEIVDVFVSSEGNSTFTFVDVGDRTLATSSENMISCKLDHVKLSVEESRKVIDAVKARSL